MTVLVVGLSHRSAPVDLLERATGDLRICKYVGFDEAQWIAPEVKTGLESAPVAAGPPLSAHEAV